MENQHEPVQMNTDNERPVTRRYNKRGKRRGKYAYAAPLGVLISLLSIVGVVALIVTGVSAIRKATDTSVLKEEIYYFLEPALVYTLAPFDSAATTEQDAFLHAAAGEFIKSLFFAFYKQDLIFAYDHRTDRRSLKNRKIGRIIFCIKNFDRFHNVFFATMIEVAPRRKT